MIPPVRSTSAVVKIDITPTIPTVQFTRSKIRHMKGSRSGRKSEEFPVDVRPRMHPHLLACLFSFVVALNAFAQKAPAKIDGGRFRTFGELLRERNVELTEPALLAALNSSDVDVRYLAAMKLAEEKVVGAVPAIKATLAAETVPRDRANIAFALGLLGDPSGRDELKRMCADESFPSEFRLYAVRYISDLGVETDEGCLHAAKDIAKLVDSGKRRRSHSRCSTCCSTA